ncbi:MAG: tetratricopeptide repeat protein [Spirochaetales bacterium]|nr:tetratricopeptide repeat protein [Spirochaetales bacterium]
MESAETIPSRSELEAAYRASYVGIERILGQMLSRIKALVEAVGLFPAYKHRVKSFNSYFSKRVKFMRDAKAQGRDPLPITDVLAVRIICPFIGDLARVEEALLDGFTVTEVERKGAETSFKEFGYQSTHLLLKIPEELIGSTGFLNPPVCEVQIRTILQDAWAEVEHELVYKADFTPFDDPMRRKLAALNATLTLSDMLFQEIRDYQHQLNNELAKRRVAFFKKVEDAIDGDLYAGLKAKAREGDDRRADSGWLGPWKSQDDLLLEALNAHNRSDYVRAIDIYSHILAMNPKAEIRAIIHKHRGMAYFAESRYDEAAEDFSDTLTLDAACYKAAYYRGVVSSVRQNYAAAIDDFNAALAIHPYHFYSTYRRAQAFYHIGDYPKALADCEVALELEPDNENVKMLKTMILAQLKM